MAMAAFLTADFGQNRDYRGSAEQSDHSQHPQQWPQFGNVSKTYLLSQCATAIFWL
jgi:hypothetical protein